MIIQRHIFREFNSLHLPQINRDIKPPTTPDCIARYVFFRGNLVITHVISIPGERSGPNPILRLRNTVAGQMRISTLLVHSLCLLLLYTICMRSLANQRRLVMINIWLISDNQRANWPHCNSVALLPAYYSVSIHSNQQRAWRLVVGSNGRSTHTHTLYTDNINLHSTGGDHVDNRARGTTLDTNPFVRVSTTMPPTFHHRHPTPTHRNRPAAGRRITRQTIISICSSETFN